MLEKVLSGFQTGADIGGILAAKAAGIATGGWMPKGWLTEDGPRPEYEQLYDAVQLTTRDYPARTMRNVCGADATLWFGTGDSRGYGCTMNACSQQSKPVYVIRPGDEPVKPSMIATWIRLGNLGKGYTSLNIAGNRESLSPGIAAKVELFLSRVFARLA